MRLLKNLPLSFTGELHEVTLLNFSVDPAEVRHLLPPSLRLRHLNGRAMISMVDVQLRNMKAKSRLLPFKFNYQHIGFRLLVEDAQHHREPGHRGIHFLRSFTNKGMIVTGGSLLTDYRLEHASLRNHAGGLELHCGDRYLKYNLQGRDHEPTDSLLALKNVVGAIDRAYAERDGLLYMTQIMREKWPLVPMICNRFSTNFFRSARLEGVFKVPETILYTWLPAIPVARTTPDKARQLAPLIGGNALTS